MFLDLDNGKGDLLSRVRGITPLAKGKEQEKMVQRHKDKRTRRRFKVSAGIEGKTVNTTPNPRIRRTPAHVFFFSRSSRLESTGIVVNHKTVILYI